MSKAKLPFDYDPEHDERTTMYSKRQKESDDFWESIPKTNLAESDDDDDDEPSEIYIDNDIERDWGLVFQFFDGLVLQRRVQALCKAKNLSTAKAEKKMSIPNGTLKKLAKNSPSASRIFLFAKYFDVSADYLLGLSDERRKYDYGELKYLWETLSLDQRKYVTGFVKGFISYEKDWKDEVQSQTYYQRRKKHLTNQIDELTTELKALEKRYAKPEHD